MISPQKKTVGFFIFKKYFSLFYHFVFICSAILQLQKTNPFFLSQMSVYNQSRSRVIQAIVIAVFLVIVFQLLNLQVFTSDYQIDSMNNAIYRKIVYPDRGIIFDHNKKAVLENTIMYDLVATPSETKGTDTLTLCAILGIDTAEYKKRMRELTFKNGWYKPSTFAPLLSDATYARLSENIYKFKGFTVVERPVRSYPYHIGEHLLGYIGEVDSNFLKKHVGEGYQSGDYAGLTGLERSYEKVLMGQRGVSRFIRDNKNRIQGSYEQGKYDTAAIAGRNLYTSLDVDVQVLAEKLLQNKIGSVVAINPKTGGIICMASAPGYDPSVLTGSERRKNFSRMLLDTARPLLNRAIKGQYPPGSTYKPLGALIALDEGLISPSYGYPCGGAYYACGRPVKCTEHWAGHAASLRLAIAHSCNSYFCNVFKMTLDNPAYPNPQAGYIKWKEYVNSFGLGTDLQVDIPGEDDGNIPDTARYNKDFGGFAKWKACNMVTLGIGQDRMLVTPLQMANAMCIIANNGFYYTPHFVDSIENETSDDKDFMKTYRTKHPVVHIADSTFQAVKEGMHDVSVVGTAKGAQIEGVNICAKTGTAQNPHGKNHSLFVAFAPQENPKIAIAVIVENAGYGATWAAPIAKLCMTQYLKDSLSEKDKKDVERISKADLIPAAIKHWYYIKDSIKQAKLANTVDVNSSVDVKSQPTSKQVDYDPEAEPNRGDNDKTDSLRTQKDMLLPNGNQNKKDSPKKNGN